MARCIIGADWANNGKIRAFNSLSEAGRYVGATDRSVVRAIQAKVPLGDWSFMYDEDWDGTSFKYEPNYHIKEIAIIGISPRGDKVRFRSVRYAATCLHVDKSGISGVLTGRRQSSFGWSWMYDDPDIECVPLTDEIAATVVMPIKRRLNKIERANRASGKMPPKAKGEVEDTREALYLGLFNPDTIPAICPICGLIMCDIKAARKHLKKCLKGHEWKICRGGVIKVYD